MSKVYYIASGYKGCNYVRCLMPMLENGWDSNKPTILQVDKPLDEVRADLTKTEIVVFHRPEKQEFHKLAQHLKSLGKKIVFDNDDTFHLDKEHPFYDLDAYGKEEDVITRNDLVHNFITNADLVTTTTKTLAKEYSEFNKNVVVIPNCVSPDDWDEPLRTKGNKVRIGVVGSVAYTQDANIIEDELRELSNRDDVQLVVFGLQSKEHRKTNKLVEEVYRREYELWDTLDIEHTPFVDIKDYPDMLNELRLDIMLIPRKDCYFNKCKSNLKFLEAAMCEIPVIASSFEDAPYEDVPDDAIIKIPIGKSWKDSIGSLIASKSLRRAIGKRAKVYTLDNFNIEKNAYKWENAYKLIK